VATTAGNPGRHRELTVLLAHEAAVVCRLPAATPTRAGQVERHRGQHQPRGVTCPPCDLVRWRLLLLAYDAGDRPEAIAQMNRRGLASEHCCSGVSVLTLGALFPGTLSPN